MFTPFFKLFVPSSLPHTKLQLIRSKSTALMSAQTKWRQLATSKRLGRPSCALAAGRLVVRSTASSARFASGTHAQESWHRYKLKKYMGLRAALDSFGAKLAQFLPSRIQNLEAQDTPLLDVPGKPFSR